MKVFVCIALSHYRRLEHDRESAPHAIRFAQSHIQTTSMYAFASICRTQEQKSVVRLWRGDEDRIGHANFLLPFDANDLAFDPNDTYQLGAFHWLSHKNGLLCM